MYKHRLASLFDPSSILVISDIDLPLSKHIPKRLEQHVEWLRWDVASQEVLLSDTSEQSATVTTSVSVESPDLALICLSSKKISLALEVLSKRRPKALIILPYTDSDPDSLSLQPKIAEWANAHNCLLLGPRAFGVQRPMRGLNLSRIPLVQAGKVAVVSQSRMILMSVLDWAAQSGVGVSTAVSTGEVSGVSLPEIIEYLAGDTYTSSIVLYLDKLSDGRALLSALRAAAGVKPVVVFRAGRMDSELLGDDSVFNAAVRRSGAVRANYILELFSALKTVNHIRRPKGGRLAIFGNGRAQTQLMWDVLGSAGDTAKLGHLSRDTQHTLAIHLGPGSITTNPVISYKPFTSGSLVEALKIIVDDPAVDAVMLILAPDEASDIEEVVRGLAEYAPKAPKPIFTTLFGEEIMHPLRQVMDEAGTPAFRNPETAFFGFNTINAYHYNQQLLQQVRIPLLVNTVPDEETVNDIIQQARVEGRSTLNSEEVRAVLRCYNADIIWSDQMDAHREEIDGEAPFARITVKKDPIFGPWIYFGEGKHEVNVSVHDQGQDLPPLNAFLAAQLIERSRFWRLELHFYAEEHHFVKLQKLLEVVSEIISEHPDIDNMQINPIALGLNHLIVDEAEICLTAAPQPRAVESGYKHLAIHPYPHYLAEHKRFNDGIPWTLRPIRPEDADALQNFIRSLSDSSRYMRFVSMMSELTPKMLTRYTYVDYDKELALVATTELPNPANRGLPQEVIIGLAHYLRNSDGVGAEYALVISDDWQRRGLGRSLMSKLIALAKRQGLEYIEGLVLSKNRPMLGLMTSLGMTNDPDPEDNSVRRLWMPFD
ncbi:MAG: GNAT family N-acetyltransferase [Alcaligenaceae bacterium]|nr:GNAT family N-acetyltransferase [Alcaligenaceae bacterium]